MRDFVGTVYALWRRELIRFYRQRGRLTGALGTPLLFWLLIGSGLGRSFQLPGGGRAMDYLEYFFPGTLLLVLLFTSIFSTISVIEDRKEGFLLSVLVAPVSRPALVTGSLIGGATLAFSQALLLLFLTPFLGLPLHLWNFLTAAGVLLFLAFALTALGFAFAWRIDSTQGFHAVMNLLLFPMWLLSGAVFPREGASVWVQWIMSCNPLTYGLAALRTLLYGGSGDVVAQPALGVSLPVTLLFGVLTGVICYVSISRPGIRSFA